MLCYEYVSVLRYGFACVRYAKHSSIIHPVGLGGSNNLSPAAKWLEGDERAVCSQLRPALARLLKSSQFATTLVGSRVAHLGWLRLCVLLHVLFS